MPFESLALPVGYGGDARPWLVPLRALVGGKPCWLLDLESSHGNAGTVLHETRWVMGQPMRPGKLARVLEQLQGLAPHCASPRQLSAAKNDGHSAHGLPSCVVMVCLGARDDSQRDFPQLHDIDVHESGRWKPRNGSKGQTAALAKGDMAVRSTSAVGRTRQIDLRRRIYEVVSSFIGDSDWRTVVPKQLGVLPSYSFLRQRPLNLTDTPPVTSAGSDPDELKEPPAILAPSPRRPLHAFAPPPPRVGAGHSMRGAGSKRPRRN